jgi:hypothetical protein
MIDLDQRDLVGQPGSPQGEGIESSPKQNGLTDAAVDGFLELVLREAMAASYPLISGTERRRQILRASRFAISVCRGTSLRA